MPSSGFIRGLECIGFGVYGMIHRSKNPSHILAENTLRTVIFNISELLARESLSSLLPFLDCRGLNLQ